MINEKPSLTPTFTMGDTKYGFIPELDNITYGEFVDLDGYLQDVQDLHKAMAVLYRPITSEVKHRYLIEPYEGAGKYSEQMKQAPMNVAMGATLFFWHLGNELLQAMLTSLEAKSQTNTPSKDNSPSNGDGMQQSINSLRETLGSLSQLHNFPSTNAYTSSPLKSKSKRLKTT
jgi:hypothetical protein